MADKVITTINLLIFSVYLIGYVLMLCYMLISTYKEKSTISMKDFLSCNSVSLGWPFILFFLR
jgi:hypothetical protein